MTAKKTAASAQDALKPMEAAVNASKETVEAVVKAGTDAATKQYEQAVSMTKENVDKASSAMFQGYDEFAELNKANVDAVITSTNTVAKGFESISKELMGFMQASVESNVVVAKKVIGAKNLQEVVDLQSDFARTSFDSLLAESAKLTELSVQVTNKAIEPLQTRAHVTVEKMMKPVAA